MAQSSLVWKMLIHNGNYHQLPVNIDINYLYQPLLLFRAPSNFGHCSSGFFFFPIHTHTLSLCFNSLCVVAGREHDRFEFPFFRFRTQPISWQNHRVQQIRHHLSGLVLLLEFVHSFSVLISIDFDFDFVEVYSV